MTSAQPGGDEAEAGQGGADRHGGVQATVPVASADRSGGTARATGARHSVIGPARCGNRFLSWPRESARVHARRRAAVGPAAACGRSSVGRASPCQGEGREFESRRPLGCGGSSRTPTVWWSGREARQRPAKPSTRVQIPSPPPRTISSAGERFPDTEEVTGSIPVSSTGAPALVVPSRAISSAGERFPDTEEVTGSIPVSRTRHQQHPAPPGTISSAGERFPDTEEVTGSIPVSSTEQHRGPEAISFRPSLRVGRPGQAQGTCPARRGGRPRKSAVPGYRLIPGQRLSPAPPPSPRGCHRLCGPDRSSGPEAVCHRPNWPVTDDAWRPPTRGGRVWSCRSGGRPEEWATGGDLGGRARRPPLDCQSRRRRGTGRHALVRLCGPPGG